MMSSQEVNHNISITDIFPLLERYSKYILKKKLYVLVAGILGLFLGIGYGFVKKPIYTAECTFVLEDNESSSISKYAGLANMIGLDMGSSGITSIFSGDNIIELYKSRLMIEKTLLSKVSNNKDLLLIDLYLSMTKKRKSWSTTKLKTFKFSQYSRSFLQDSLLSNIIDNINHDNLIISKPDKKLNIFKVSVRSRNEIFSKVFADKIVETVNDFYVTTKTKKSALNIKILQRQTDSVRTILNKSIGIAASSIDAFPNANSALQALKVPSQRKQIDIRTNSQIYEELVKNLELSKMTLLREAPLIQIIDEPRLPLLKQTPSPILFGLIGLFLGLVIMMLTILFLEYFYSRTNKLQ